MRLGYIGLGKMGSNMVARLLEKKHRVTVFDVNQRVVRSQTRKGAEGARSIEELVNKLTSPRLIWIMVPHQFVDSVLNDLVPLLEKGDVVIDGGNSHYKQSIQRAKNLAKQGVAFLDVGVSGGPKGARNGACLMIGGSKSVYKKHERLFKDLAVTDGYKYLGPSGAGHFVKMIHNGIEYGMMQAIAEGFDIMKQNRHFDLNLRHIAEVYAHGSVIESRLIVWLKEAFAKFGANLKSVSGKAVESGEGRWTTEVAHELKVPDHVIHEAFRARKRTQKHPSFQGKIIMALRNQFGGHDVNPKSKT